MALGRLGLLLTLAWLVLAGLYVAVAVGFGNLLFLLPQEIALFVIGVVLPLGVLWSILGFFRQNESLRQLEGRMADARAIQAAVPTMTQSPPAPAPAQQSWVSDPVSDMAEQGLSAPPPAPAAAQAETAPSAQAAAPPPPSAPLPEEPAPRVQPTAAAAAAPPVFTHEPAPPPVAPPSQSVPPPAEPARPDGRSFLSKFKRSAPVVPPAEPPLQVMPSPAPQAPSAPAAET